MIRGNTPPDTGARLRAGDESVLEVILRMHGPPILALLRQRFVGPLTTADFEDILSTALFRIWQNRTKFDPTLASLRVWFYRIAENIARDVLKHGWHKARQLEQGLDPAELASVIDHRSNDRERNHDHHDAGSGGTGSTLRVPPDQLRELLDLLPENQRRIVLADADSPEGSVSSGDLAKELGIPASTVRVYRRRALERLRREIERLDPVARSSPADALS